MLDEITSFEIVRLQCESTETELRIYNSKVLSTEERKEIWHVFLQNAYPSRVIIFVEEPMPICEQPDDEPNPMTTGEWIFLIGSAVVTIAAISIAIYLAVVR